MTNTNKLLELTQDVVNPHYDKRRSYGQDKVAVFRKGTKFAVQFHSPAYVTRLTNGLPEAIVAATLKTGLVSSIIVIGGVRLEDRDLVDAFMAHSAPAETETWADISTMQNLGVDAQDVINRLLRDKHLSQEMLVAAMKQLDDEWHVKEQARLNKTSVPS